MLPKVGTVKLTLPAPYYSIQGHSQNFNKKKGWGGGGRGTQLFSTTRDRCGQIGGSHNQSLIFQLTSVNCAYRPFTSDHVRLVSKTTRKEYYCSILSKFMNILFD